MRLYALRDRLLDYYLQPFVAPNDNAVRASLSQTILQGGDNSAIAQAPHHFEIWVVAEINDETLTLTPIHQLLGDCHSLIRPKSPPKPQEEPLQRTLSPPLGNGAGQSVS